MRRHHHVIHGDTENVNSETRGYTFHFQIANDGSRKACSVRVRAPSHQRAAELFRHNWLTIEAKARSSLTNGPEGSGTVEIDLP